MEGTDENKKIDHGRFRSDRNPQSTDVQSSTSGEAPNPTQHAWDHISNFIHTGLPSSVWDPKKSNQIYNKSMFRENRDSPTAQVSNPSWYFHRVYW